MQDMSFNDELNRLNPEQRQAVDRIYGPVMVIAGPGTGKTQILAMRIGQILNQTDTLASNILCLTYTDAGTVAMRKRLTRLIGPEAYNIHIYTFHAFCNKIIQEYADLFSNHEDLRAIDDLERLDLYMEMIDAWPTDHPLKKLKGDPYFAMKGLKELFRNMKSEGWSSAYMIQRIDQYINELPTLPDFTYKRKYKGHAAGDPNLNKIEKEVKSLERIRAAAYAFDEYNALMVQKGRYDYADMILWVLNALRSNEDLRYDLQEQYQFMLVDEYQDTNGAQNDILFELCGDPADQPNVFVVGDDDQAIYRFQGANLSNITSFKNRFKEHLLTVVLKDNYRSSSDILNGAADLIANNKERLTNQMEGVEKILIAAGSQNKSYESGILIGDFETEPEELLGVQNYIDSLLTSGVNPQEIAVLFRMRKHVAPLIKYFIDQRIPYNVAKIDNVLVDPFILKLISLLRYIQSEIDNPLDNSNSLFDILHYPWFDIPALDIAQLAVAKVEDREKNWRAWINDDTLLSKLPLKASSQISAASELIEALIKKGVNETPQQLFEAIIYSKPVFSYIKESGEAFLYLQTVNSLFEFLKDQMDKHERYTLQQFLGVLDKMTNHDIKLSLSKIDKTGEGIQLMTAHGSKGLEFEHVIIIGCNDSKWEEASAPAPAFKYPPTLIPSNTINQVEDERRLFYVCLTRAKKEALITHSKELLNGKTAPPSRFVTEVVASHHHNSYSFEASTTAKETFLSSQFAPRPIQKTDYPPQIDDMLDQLTLNISGVNKYLSCPLAYYYENILRAPQGRTSYMGYGQAVHHALEKLFIRADQENGSFPSVDLFLRFFDDGMKKYHSHFTEKESEDLTSLGHLKLTAYYEAMIDEWKQIKSSATEVKIKDIQIEGIPVTGIFDRVDIVNGRLNIVDYKTGNYKAINGPQNNIDELLTELTMENDPDKRDKIRLKIEGDNYWRQLVFYKLMVNASNKWNEPFESAYISFVESDDYIKGYKKQMTITPDDEQVVKDQLTSTYKKIKDKAFSQGCGREWCSWCRLHGSGQK